MKKLTLFVTVLFVGIVFFNTKIFASELEVEPILEKELYISEVSITPNNKYVEIFINEQVFEDNYYIITATSETASPSTINRLNEISKQLSGEYYVFEVLTENTGLALNNPQEKRIVFLCENSQTTKKCQSDPLDMFEYGKLLNTEYSWSRDFEDELKIKMSNKTEGLENDFEIVIVDDGDEDNDNDPEDSEPEEEMVMCSFISINEISFSNPDKFIEIKNTTAENINLEDCSLRRGNAYIDMDGYIFPGEIKVFSILDSELNQTNNSVNIHIYDKFQQKNVVSVAYKAKSSTSFAWLEVSGVEGWYSTYLMTPGQENIHQSFPNCEVGYHLNVVTNKCNKDPDPPVECAEGQFRNPETGRCKKLPEAKVLAECPEGQFRNPETNRCKKIATEDDLIPCAEGYERNPETNRCRKIVSGESAEYAVEPYSSTNENRSWATIGIAAICGLGIIIVIQFRHEIINGIKKIIGRTK